MSSCSQYTAFKGVSQLTENNLINEVEENLKAYLDWGFLNIGGFINVNIPTSGLYGGTFHQLKTVEVQGYRAGQVWQGPKKDWVWESGCVYNDGTNNYSPKNISGVFINSVFVPGPTGIATTGYYINYPLGQIIFDKPLPKTTKLELNYAYRWCQVYKFSSDPYIKQLQELAYQPSPQINQIDKGDYNLGANHRAQMPCIIIEPASNSYSNPWQLGSDSMIVGQDFMLHVLAESASDKNRLADIIRLQKERTLELYDLNKVVKSGVYPIDYRGSVNISGLLYDNLIKQYFWNKTYIKNVDILNMESLNKNLYWCTIRLTSETII
jgi:hypothetical protein